MVLDPETLQPIFAGSTRTGLRNVGSYQVSGHPYITGSLLAAGVEECIRFPYVTKNLTLICSGSASSIRMHFNSASSGRVMEGGHYISLDNDEDALSLDVKCKAVWVTQQHPSPSADGGFQLMASLTNIPHGQMYPLTGSGLTD